MRSCWMRRAFRRYDPLRRSRRGLNWIQWVAGVCHKASDVMCSCVPRRNQDKEGYDRQNALRRFVASSTSHALFAFCVVGGVAQAPAKLIVSNATIFSMARDPACAFSWLSAAVAGDGTAEDCGFW